MKKFNLLNFSLACALMAAPMVGVAQTNMPSFQDNWYIDYVGGGRVSVTAPASISKSLNYTIANDGDASGDWGAPLSFLSGEVVKANPYEACNSVAPGSLTGKIALVLRGNCEFGVKAKQAQDAGAIAVVIVNHLAGGPVGMGPGAVGNSVTIPVIMISKDDGAAISAQLDQSVTVNMNFSKWGKNLTNDLAILDRGIAYGHSFALPVGQMSDAANVNFYKMVDGAVIGNFGSATAQNVTVHSKLTWVPNNGNPTVVKTHTMNVGSFAPTDSVKSPFADEVYSLNNHTLGDKGRYDLEYYVTSDVPDDFPGDDTQRTSFYVTDNLISKGRFDFANNEPFRSAYVRWGTSDFMQGPLVFVAKGGYTMKEIKFSVSNSTPDDPTLGGPFDMLVYKWVDGSNGQPQDGRMQSGENTYVGSGTKDVFGAGDTSNAVMSVMLSNRVDPNKAVVTEDNSWYWIAANVPSGNFLGTDGELNYQPRTWARNKVTTGAVLEPFAITVGANDGTYHGDPTLAAAMFPSEGATIDEDSVRFSNQRSGQVGALPLMLSPFPVSVANVASTITNVDLYPNPATDVLNVSVKLEKEAKQVRYTIFDQMGKRISYEYHNNVKNDVYQVQTSKLPGGSYFLMVSADGVQTMKQFTIVK